MLGGGAKKNPGGDKDKGGIGWELPRGWRLVGWGLRVLENTVAQNQVVVSFEVGQQAIPVC